MLDTIRSRLSKGSQSRRFEHYIQSDPENHARIFLRSNHASFFDSKGVVKDTTAHEQCCSSFRGEPAFEFTPDKLFKSSNIVSDIVSAQF
jgi:hypothetical protein